MCYEKEIAIRGHGHHSSGVILRCRSPEPRREERACVQVVAEDDATDFAAAEDVLKA